MNKIKVGMVLFYFFIFLILGVVMTIAIVYSGWLSVKPIADAEGPWYYYQFYLVFIIAFGVGMPSLGLFFYLWTKFTEKYPQYWNNGEVSK